MVVPITVLASPRPSAAALRHVQGSTTLIASRSVALGMGAHELIAAGRMVISEPDVFFRSPGCPCCAVREDLVAAVIRATRRTDPPERIVVYVDPCADDVLTVISTLLSSFEVSRRCSLDAVVVAIDAVELATRLATGSPLVDPGTATALAIADRVVIGDHEQVLDAALATIRSALGDRAGFARLVDDGDLPIEADRRLDAWHGAPDARAIAAAGHDEPATIVLRVDEPLDPDAIDDWLDVLVAQHASRLLRLQGALSVVGHADRTCCYGVLSFATSHSEREHDGRGSAESVLAICGIGLDADELAASFRATVAS